VNLRRPDELQEALGQRAEEEGRSMHATAIQAIGRCLVEEADRATVRRPGAEYAAEHADLPRRPGE
jgi:predicted transcriptional regulator